MIPICIWMNIPSHYQSSFFQALDERTDIDLQVRYLNGVSSKRAAEGWNDHYECRTFEKIVNQAATPEAMLDTMSDASIRIHIVSGHFCGELTEYLCANNLRWCHWSEMPGIRLAEMLGYRVGLFRLLNPMMLLMKRSEGRRIERHGMGAFGQGYLAHRAFQLMGVSPQKICDLFYVPSALPDAEPCDRIITFAKGRKVFLSVGALCRRKGVDLLIKAFAKIDSDEWCLVFCGLDREDGTYQALASNMGLAERVLFMGAHPAERIAEVYAAADVFILPSRFDGWGAVLNEAASRGMPLIGTDLCGASWHLIEPGVTGYRVKAGSARDLADAMRIYVDQPGLCKVHGLTARRRFDEHFTPEQNASRLIAGLQAWGAE